MKGHHCTTCIHSSTAVLTNHMTNLNDRDLCYRHKGFDKRRSFSSQPPLTSKSRFRRYHIDASNLFFIKTFERIFRKSLCYIHTYIVSKTVAYT